MKVGFRHFERNCKVLVMMKPALLGWAKVGVEKSRAGAGQGRVGQEQGKSQAGQEQGRSRNRAGVW